MTYNQEQLFQINDFANHYVDNKITGYRVLYSESIADIEGRSYTYNLVGHSWASWLL